MLPAVDVHTEELLDPLVGRCLDGRWTIVEPMARSGMGVVYRGMHVELGREAAIKVLSSAGAQRERAFERFLREARVASRIDHPNIVEILDMGRLEDGAPYLVMEMLEGEDLAERIAHEGPMSLSRVVELLGPIASALDAVHAAGLLHRDIKPANIFLAHRLDGTVAPTLIDFGLAALRDDEPDQRLTRQGVVVGTPQYVSPEAAMGETLDWRSDIYSLAVVAFQLLTGVLPFDGHEPRTVLVEKVQKPAPSLSSHSDKSHPPALEQLMARALSRNPDRRPPSASAFIDALARCTESNPLEPARLPSTETPKPLMDARFGWVIGVASILMAGALAWTVWSAWPRKQEMVVRPLDAAQPTVEPGAHPETRPLPTPQVVVPVTPDPAIDRETAVAPQPTAVDGPPEPRRTRSATPQRPPATTSPLPHRAAELTRQAAAAMVRGRFPHAQELFRSATEADPDYPAAWRGLGLVNERLGRIPEATRAYRRYLALATDAPDFSQVRERLERLER